MAVAFAVYVDGTISSGSTTAAVNLSTRALNDLVFVMISRSANVAPTGVPHGWQLLKSHGGTYSRYFYAKTLEQGDIATVTWTWAASVKVLAHAAVYTGASIVSSAKGTWTTGASNTQTCGSITSTNAWLAQFAGGYSTSAKTYTAQATYPERRDNGGTSPDFWHLITDTNGGWTSGASNPTFAYDSAATCTYTGGFQVELANWTPPTTTGISLYGTMGFFGV